MKSYEKMTKTERAAFEHSIKHPAPTLPDGSKHVDAMDAEELRAFEAAIGCSPSNAVREGRRRAEQRRRNAG